MRQLSRRAAVKRLHPDVADAFLSGGIRQTTAIGHPAQPAVKCWQFDDQLWLATVDGKDGYPVFEVQGCSISASDDLAIWRDVRIINF